MPKHHATQRAESSALALLLLGAFTLSPMGCDSSTDVRRGNLEVRNYIRLTHQAAADPDGVLLIRDSTDARPRALIDSLVFVGLAEGPHTLEIADLAANCTVDPPNPRSVTVYADSTVAVYWLGLCQ